ncbi:glycerophosphodiester phosphodiesterase [Paenarthrobacter sp. DKR-5]|uniref:glycerophosphodiester phosphodiesterase n=1 Tax=Paenarthrobacter sp. DKR-5 TaxID=2835535 RepID=UPI001BDC40A7|nr:glycerophosphodiester phosphodiesterase [Paenarthrobacter sp. DKR-5]MBT1003254.1 glycerophosphodiester phosphodiesterase [Paenarthrobacter sp. DKR-5]
MPYLQPGPLAFAHRGFSAEGLENSLPAFHAAEALGFSYLETDVHTTADGVAVVFHDESLDRVTDGTGRINELTGEDVARVRIGGREAIPTLAELLAALPEARFNLDVKDEASVETLAAAIEQAGAHERVLVASFSDRRRRAVLKRLSRPTASSAGIRVTAAFVLLGPLGLRPLLRRLLRDVDCLQVPERRGFLRIVSARTVARAHAYGLQLHVWTINEPVEMHRLLDLGVDGIMTDRADLLREVMRERGHWA